MFNVIDLETGWKADLIFLSNDPFDNVEFHRRCAGELFGVPVSFISPEGCILSKLRWAAASGSERQMRDAASVIRNLGKTIDREYLREWAPRLGVGDKLEVLLEAAEQ